MSIVKIKNQSGATYAYESISVWDPDKKQARPIRKYLGRVDPETGEIIKTEGRKGRPKKEPETNADYKKLYDDCTKKLAKAEEKIARLESEKRELLLITKKAADAAAAISAAVSLYSEK